MEESAERRVSTAQRAFLNFCGPTLAKGLQSSLLYMTCLGWSSWDTQCCSPAFFRFCSPRSKIPRLLRPILATSSTRSTTVSIQSRPHASYPRLPRKAPGPLASVLLTSSAISIKPARLAHRIRLARRAACPGRNAHIAAAAKQQQYHAADAAVASQKAYLGIDGDWRKA